MYPQQLNDGPRAENSAIRIKTSCPHENIALLKDCRLSGSIKTINIALLRSDHILR